jgi:hypothetical protein
MRVLLCCIAFLSSMALCAEDLKPADNAKVYKATESQTVVTVVELLPISKGDVLLMVDKSNSVIDGLVIRHKTQVQGKGQAFVMDFEGPHTRMRADDGFWWKQYSLYLPESPTKTVDLYYSEKLSKAVKTADIVKKYKSQDAKAVEAKLTAAYDS